jgi:hypothetical protein
MHSSSRQGGNKSETLRSHAARRQPIAPQAKPIRQKRRDVQSSTTPASTFGRRGCHTLYICIGAEDSSRRGLVPAAPPGGDGSDVPSRAAGT